MGIRDELFKGSFFGLQGKSENFIVDSDYVSVLYTQFYVACSNKDIVI